MSGLAPSEISNDDNCNIHLNLCWSGTTTLFQKRKLTDNTSFKKMMVKYITEQTSNLLGQGMSCVRIYYRNGVRSIGQLVTKSKIGFQTTRWLV